VGFYPTNRLQTLVEFYSKHIEKENKAFFLAVRAYFNFTEDEDQAMLSKFWEFDRQMIHDKYKAMVEGLEKSE
jgi:hemerythrin-like domain-containing protein